MRPLCPHCEWPLREEAGRYHCGICGKDFSPAEVGQGVLGEEALEYAREILKAQEEASAHMGLVDMQGHPAPFWKKMLSLMGLPVEELDYGTTSLPLFSFLFVAASALIFFLGFGVESWLWLDPTQPFRNYGSTFFTYALTHASLTHLLGNFLFVFPFLNNVEDDLGHGAFLLLLFVSAIGAALLHVFFDPRSLPLLGASGVCFAVATYYCLRHPRHRFLVAVPVLGVLAWQKRLRVHAWLLLLFYVGFELFDVAGQRAGVTDVSHLGHIGGATIGFIFYLIAP